MTNQQRRNRIKELNDLISPYHEKIIGFATLFLTILLIFFIRKSEKSQEFITSEFALHSILLVAFLIIFVFNVSNEIRKVEEGEFTGTNIITKDSTYNSTDSAFFIGQTSKIYILSQQER